VQRGHSQANPLPFAFCFRTQADIKRDNVGRKRERKPKDSSTEAMDH